MKAIRVRFCQPTETKPARLKADDGEGHIHQEAYDYENAEQQAQSVAEKLRDRSRWKPNCLVGGSYKNDWYFVQIES